MFDFKDNFVTLVSANELEDTNNFTMSLIKMISGINNNNVVLFDTNGTLNDNYDTNISYINNNFDELFKKIIDNMKMEYDVYVKDGYSNKTVKTYRNMVVVISNFNKFLLKISQETKENFFNMLEKIKDLQTFDFILTDQVDNFKKIEYDKWYKTVVDNNYGIWVGSGIADQTVIKTNIGFKKTNNEVPKGYGLVVRNTKTYLVNLVSEDKEGKNEQ